MSTGQLYYGQDIETRLTADGAQPAGFLEQDGQCPTDPLCADAGQIACSFLDLLPNGPMWDRHKQEARDIIQREGGIPTRESECQLKCHSMVVYAVFLGQILAHMVETALRPSVLEASPHTACQTIDDWLERFAWIDCYRSTCRTDYLSQFSPYEHDGDCGSDYFPTTFDADFELALKHAILRSLARMQRGIIKNVDSINWVIEPLGARISPRQPYSPLAQDYVDTVPDPNATYTPGSVENCETCFCGEVSFEICNTGDTLPQAPCNPCLDATQTVAAQQTYTQGDGTDVQLYPGVIAAECIVRSLLGRQCPNIVHRC